MKRYEECIQPIRTALQYSPKMAQDAHFKLGTVFMILKQVMSALDPLREALKDSPDNEKVQNLLAEALY